VPDFGSLASDSPAIALPDFATQLALIARKLGAVTPPFAMILAQLTPVVP
jgi:hypothetical protein